MPKGILIHFKKQSACNIIFRTAIVRAHHIRFNENLNTYVDWSFVLEYMKYVNKFVRILTSHFISVGKSMIHLKHLH